MPKIRFERIDNDKYLIEFILIDEIEEDIISENAEELPNSIPNEKRTEGKVKFYYSKKYERDPQNRADAIAFHGCKCKICGFDFEVYYGRRGRGYIEIHHINPLSNNEEEVDIDPKTDLIPVCANCHRIIHRRRNYVLSIEEMLELISSHKK